MDQIKQTRSRQSQPLAYQLQRFSSGNKTLTALTQGQVNVSLYPFYKALKDNRKVIMWAGWEKNIKVPIKEENLTRWDLMDGVRHEIKSYEYLMGYLINSKRQLEDMIVGQYFEEHSPNASPYHIRREPHGRLVGFLRTNPLLWFKIREWDDVKNRNLIIKKYEGKEEQLCLERNK